MALLEKVYNGFIKFFGDIKVYKFPFFLLYDPGSYKVKGEDIRQVIKIIQPGDILLRGYVNYLDGYVIPGFFSHAGLYVGEVKESDSVNLKPDQLDDFRTGDQMVVHSMAEGVFMEDVINFCRCDYMMILRRNLALESEESRKIKFSDVYNIALNDLGLAYDFKFDFQDFNKLSCTELVFDCCKGFIHDYGVEIKTRRVMLMKKRLITPDDYANSKLEMVWKSQSIGDKQMKEIKKQ
jgi:hypothetical protein